MRENDPKRVAYSLGDYKFSPPPVSTAYWNYDNWIEWITNHGVFNNLDFYRRKLNQCSI